MANLESLTDAAEETRHLQRTPPAWTTVAGRDRRLYLHIKRLMDIVLALMVLILLSPLLLLMALLIKSTVIETQS